MQIIEGFKEAKAALSRRPGNEFSVDSPAIKQRLKKVFGIEIEPEQAVEKILDEVQRRGDAALLDYTAKIDGVRLSSLEVSSDHIAEACQKIDEELHSALQIAAERIRSFHQQQKDSIWSIADKKGFGQLIRPLKRIGAYAPGGIACYPSTVLMTAIPAKVAGVKEVILVTPPSSNGGVPQATLAAADIAQVDRVFSIGGAQAIAALAFGTESVPRVDKICGPGNIFVVLAKKLVYGSVGIDGLPGPSEILIIADNSANPVYCAADMLAQAEHDPLASTILITTSKKLAETVEEEIEKQLDDLKRQPIATQSLQDQGMIIVVGKMDEAIELANIYAPEHLSLMVKGAKKYVDKLTNAGCIFVGETSTVVMGDYVAGPSHVLPTEGTARFGSPLNILDFVKFTSVIDIDKKELETLGKAATTIAQAEGLYAHAKAVNKRLQKK